MMIRSRVVYVEGNRKKKNHKQNEFYL